MAGGAGGGKGGFGTFAGGDGGTGGPNSPGNPGGAGGAFGNGGAGDPLGGGGGGGVGGGGGGAAGGGGFGGGGAAGDGVTEGGFGGGFGSLGGGGGGSGYGGALFNMGADSTDPGSGQATLLNCTLCNNTAQGGDGGDGNGYGGAIYNLDGRVELDSDTLAFNTVRGGAAGPLAPGGDTDGGAVYSYAFGSDIDTGALVSALLVLNNSILANSSNGVHDLSSVTGKPNKATVSGSHNLVMHAFALSPDIITLMADPQLGMLQNNGGPTQTLLPMTGSPVLGAGNPKLSPATDQRGDARPAAGPTDLGSVQISTAITPTPTSTPAPTPASSSAPAPTPTPTPTTVPSISVTAPNLITTRGLVANLRGIAILGQGSTLSVHVHATRGSLLLKAKGVKILGANSSSLTVSGTSAAVGRALGGLALNLGQHHASAVVTVVATNSLGSNTVRIHVRS
jgi:hypothetical protein